MFVCKIDQIPRKLSDTYILKWIELQSQNSSCDSCDRDCLLLLPLPIHTIFRSSAHLSRNTIAQRPARVLLITFRERQPFKAMRRRACIRCCYQPEIKLYPCPQEMHDRRLLLKPPTNTCPSSGLARDEYQAGSGAAAVGCSRRTSLLQNNFFFSFWKAPFECRLDRLCISQRANNP